MWLTVLFVILFAGGLIVAIAGGGPIGFVLAAIGVIAFLAKFAGAYGTQRPNAADHAERGRRLERGEPTGPAHEGQTRMTPEQI
jgi:hypothetical protein